MKDKNRLLTVEVIINLALGILLLFFAMTKALDLPKVEANFYINMLGAVSFGIGIVLLLGRFSDQLHVRGLGIAGAIAINLFGVGMLITWLMFGNLNLSTGGKHPFMEHRSDRSWSCCNRDILMIMERR